MSEKENTDRFKLYPQSISGPSKDTKLLRMSGKSHAQESTTLQHLLDYVDRKGVDPSKINITGLNAVIDVC